MKLYSFLDENCMCSAGITAYESPATNAGTFQDVYCDKKRHKKSLKKKKSIKQFTTPNPLK